MTGGDVFWSLRGREYRLGAPVEGAGEGVYSVPLSREIVARLDLDDGSDPAIRERKVEAMLKKPPALPDVVEDGEHFVRMDWPVASLHDRSRRFVGFLMPAVDMQATSPLEYVLQERQARAEGLPTSLGARINLAARLAVAINELHLREHRVVYLTPANLRFYRQTLHVSLIGCERFSINANHERFAAHPDGEASASHYLAPEFQEKPIPPGQEEAQDRFALAVLVFQLLNFGIHPFTGIPRFDDVPDDIPGRIARNCYAYGSIPNPDLDPSPGSGHLAMPKELQALFDRAFAVHGGKRPPAQDWAAWLQFFAIPSNNCVVVCRTNPRHHHFADLPCAACARAALLPGTESETDLVPEDGTVDAVEAIEPPFVPVEKAYPPARQFPPAKRPPLLVQRWAALRNLSWLRKLAALTVCFVAISSVVILAVSLATKSPVTVSIPRPAEAPAPPALDPYLAGDPAQQQSESLTDGYIKSAALAITTNDRPEWQRAITNLHTDAPEHASAPPNDSRAAFASFAAGLSPDRFDERKWVALVNQLRQELKKNPYDDEAAYELGWLNLVGGQRDEARDLFLHAIWLNPDRAHAWYGLGILAANDKLKTGVLATAELLTPDPTQAESMRKAFPPLLLRLSSVNPDHFAVLLAKARKLADSYRPWAAPPKYE